MRGREGVAVPGWDGQVRCDVDDPHVPRGASGWELGTSREPRHKAQSDMHAGSSIPKASTPRPPRTSRSRAASGVTVITGVTPGARTARGPTSAPMTPTIWRRGWSGRQASTTGSPSSLTASPVTSRLPTPGGRGGPGGHVSSFRGGSSSPVATRRSRRSATRLASQRSPPPSRQPPGKKRSPSYAPVSSVTATMSTTSMTSVPARWSSRDLVRGSGSSTRGTASCSFPHSTTPTSVPR